MKIALCGSCGASFPIGASIGLVEIDERCLEAMRNLMGAQPGSLLCPLCQQPSKCTPACVVWTDRATRGEVFAGGPWADVASIDDWLPGSALQELRLHASLGALQSTVDAGCVSYLEILNEALMCADPDAHPDWFEQNCLRLGAEVYVAAILAFEGLLSAQIQNYDADELDETLSRLQARACLTMCGAWSHNRYMGKRLQEDIDAIVYPGAVGGRAVEFLAEVLRLDAFENITVSYRAALESTFAWLCYCTNTENERIAFYTRTVLDLEVLATAAGGSLPLAAHAIRQDSDRLKTTLDPRALEEAIFASRGPSDAVLIETARRLGHPDATKHLVRIPTPEWLTQLRAPGVLANMLIMDGSQTVLGAQAITADRVPQPIEWFNAPPEDDASEEMQPHQVFISYSSRDRLRADIIARYLRRAGLSVFMDHHTVAGDLWARQISRQLHASKLVLALWSRDSIRSKWVIKEAEVAVGRGVLHQALLAPVAVPAPFAHVQAMRLEGWASQPEHPELRRMASELCSALGCRATLSTGADLECASSEYGRAEVAEAVFDLCNAAAWHALSLPTEASMDPVGPAYARLKAALAPAGDKEVHELLGRFDLARTLLLASICLLCEYGLDAPTLPIRGVSRSRTPTMVSFDCTGTQIWRSHFVSALSDLAGAVVRTVDKVESSHGSFVELPKGLSVEVSPHPANMLAIGLIQVRTRDRPATDPLRR